MDKSNFKKLALMGMTGGMLIASQSPAHAETISSEAQTVLSASCGAGSCGTHSSPKQKNPSSAGCGGQNAPKAGCGSRRPDRSYTADAQADVQSQYQQHQQFGGKMTEGDLLSQLNDEGKAIYRGLDAEGRSLALKLASQDCKAKNDCKGLNACNGATNDCAGRGSCKGTSPAPFKNKTDAVKIAAQKIAEKRAKVAPR